MMTTHSGGEPIGPDPPRRSRLPILIPMSVAAMTLGLIGWSAWPTLKPVRAVAVTQAVFDRSSESTTQPATGPADDAGIDHSGATVQAPGWLEAEPFYVACTALADGVVETMEVLEGDRVEKGQVVARLVSEDTELLLQRREAELASAKSNLALAKAELQAAQTAWDEPIDLQRAVETSKAAVAERKAELEQLPSLIESAKATLVRLEEEFTRIQRLRDEGAAPRIELVIARQEAAAQRATVASLEARRPMLQASIQRLQAELQAARRNLELRIEDRRRLEAARATVAEAKASVDRAKAARDEAALELQRMTIRSPIDGYVQQRLKVPGDKVIRMMDSAHSAHVVHLYNPDRIQVRVDVPLADTPHVYVGQHCEVIVEALPDRVFQGVVLRTTHEADLQKNTLEMKVKVINPSPLLRPEMLTRVKFLPPAGAAGSRDSTPNTDNSRLRVPVNAIEDRNGAQRVWTVTNRRGDRGVLQPVTVQTIDQTDGWSTINGPLNPGAILVADPNDLREGEPVRIQPGISENAL